MVMMCDVVREALSARLDGEPTELTTRAVDGHLRGCADCREWADQAEALHRRLRLAPAPTVPDLTEGVLAAVAAEGPPPTGDYLGPRLALGCLAVFQLVISVPILLLGHDHTAPVHVAHEVGSFDAALGLGLLCAALRPRFAVGMTPLFGAITALLLVTATSDVVSGRTNVGDEIPHVSEVVGFLLLAYLAVLSSRTTRMWRNA